MDQILVTLRTPQPPNLFWGSLLHGVLMELLPAPLPEQLHEGSVRPFSQWVEVKSSTQMIWHVQTMDDALGDVLLDILSKEKTLPCKHLQCSFEIESIAHTRTSMQKYMQSVFLTPQPARGLVMTFTTTTTHKTDGRYAIFPSAELIGRSLCRRLCDMEPDFALADEEVLEQVLSHVRISRYKLQSSTYALEGHYVTGYFGRLELHFDGPDPVKRLAETLFRFAAWSGVGIKTALGMGGCTVERLPERTRK